MAHPRSNRRNSRIARFLAPGLALGVLGHAAGCVAVSEQPAPEGVFSPVTIQAPDPTKSIYYSWKPIDDAVIEGAIQHVVVATPEAGGGPERRSYSLLASRDRPGTLWIERVDDGGAFISGGRVLTIAVRIGHLGDADLEYRVAQSIRKQLDQAVNSPD